MVPRMKHAPIAHHPLTETPYNKLFHAGSSAHGVPLYAVLGGGAPPCKAPTALRSAFNLYGGRCFYCRAIMPPHVSMQKMSLDHVVPRKQGGTSLLHNLVIACKDCNRAKAALPIGAFRQEASRAYLDALEAHIADAIRALSAGG